MGGALGKGLTSPHYDSQHVMKCDTVPRTWAQGLVAGLC
jgi:hypothetical protein